MQRPFAWRQVAQPAMLAGGGSLRGYQLGGVRFLLSLVNNRVNGILADEMGLGKTIQTIALLAHLAERRGSAGPHLVLAPKARACPRPTTHSHLEAVACRRPLLALSHVLHALLKYHLF